MDTFKILSTKLAGRIGLFSGTGLFAGKQPNRGISASALTTEDGFPLETEDGNVLTV